MVKRWSWFTVALLLVMSAFSVTARAAEDSEAGLDLTLRSSAAALPVTTADGSALETPASHMYLVDYDTGTVLAEKAGDKKMYPSSMTKMMTLHLIFDGLKKGTLTLASQFTMNPRTWTEWNNRGSSMFIPINSSVTLEELVRGIAIQSGNDACVVVAEGIAGSEESFAKQMNDAVKKLGMNNSNFTDSTGWPNPNHYTTPHDLAIVATSLIRDYPEYYHYLSEREFTYHNIRQYNRNLLLGNTAMQVDGLKTGHTDAAGYGITLSAKDPVSGRRLVLVVNGLDSEAARASEGERLLTWGFRNFDNLVLFKPGASIATAQVWGGKAKEVKLSVAGNVVLSIPKLGRDKVKIVANYSAPLIAPVAAGQEIGTLDIILGNGEKKQYKLVVAEAVEKLGFFGRFKRALGM